MNARVPTPPHLPGIVGLMAYRPETAQPLNMLAELLLRSSLPGSTLSAGERELIAAVVSTRNDCSFCASSHAAFAAAQLKGGKSVVDAARKNANAADVSPKLKALLTIAEQVQKSGRAVTDDAVETARAAGASMEDVHDTVLIAAAFCMYNRYVDGLRAVTPTDPAVYDEIAKHIVTAGYMASM